MVQSKLIYASRNQFIIYNLNNGAKTQYNITNLLDAAIFFLQMFDKLIAQLQRTIF